MRGARGRGTLEKEKPPIFGMIQRSGEVMIQMLANVQQKTIKPIIESVIVLEQKYILMNMIFMLDYLSGDIYTKQSIMALVNLHETRMAMGFMKCMLIRWKVFGLCCAHGYDLIEEFHKKSYQYIWDFLSLFTT